MVRLVLRELGVRVPLAGSIDQVLPMSCVWALLLGNSPHLSICLLSDRMGVELVFAGVACRGVMLSFSRCCRVSRVSSKFTVSLIVPISMCSEVLSEGCDKRLKSVHVKGFCVFGSS